MSIESAFGKNIGSNNNYPGRLCGRVAVVTGAAQGFGRGITERFLEEGAAVLLVDLPEKAEKAGGITRAFPGQSSFFACDVSDERQVKAAVDNCCELFGGVDILVSNAGIAGAGSIFSLSTEEFMRVQSVNFYGYYYFAKYCSAVMAARFSADNRRWGDIIQINSKSGLSGSKANFAYSSSKFASTGLTQSLALELAPYHIKVNSVCPGNYYEGEMWSAPETGLFDRFLSAGKVPGAENRADVKAYYLSKQPLNHRGCLPGDVAAAVLYCIEQKFETGQSITVTGGQIMS